MSLHISINSVYRPIHPDEAWPQNLATCAQDVFPGEIALVEPARLGVRFLNREEARSTHVDTLAELQRLYTLWSGLSERSNASISLAVQRLIIKSPGRLMLLLSEADSSVEDERKQIAAALSGVNNRELQMQHPYAMSLRLGVTLTESSLTNTKIMHTLQEVMPAQIQLGALALSLRTPLGEKDLSEAAGFVSAMQP